MKTLGIVGYCGFVGNAVFQGMKHAFKIVGYDAKYPGMLHVDSGIDTKLIRSGDNPALRVCLQDQNVFEEMCSLVDGPIFVCVPTPMQANGASDTSIVEGVVQSIDQYARPGMVIVIKSTVPPGTTERLNASCHNAVVCFNPEFLREVSANEDFKKQDRVIIGGPHKATKVVKTMYQIAYPEVPTTKTSSTIAEMVKYVTNCFLATKVSFANEIKQVCDQLEIDYDKVIEYATKDKRLGSSHWAVPGPDGKFGFGKACFPKDLNALIAKAEALGLRPTLMKAVWEKNLEVRPERDWEKLIGRAVTK